MKKIPLMLSSSLLMFSTFANADTAQAINYDHDQFAKTRELYMLSQLTSNMYTKTNFYLYEDKDNDPMFSSRKPAGRGVIEATVTLPNCATNSTVKQLEEKGGVKIKSLDGDVTIAAFKTIAKYLNKMDAKYMVISWQDSNTTTTDAKIVSFSDYLQNILVSRSSKPPFFYIDKVGMEGSCGKNKGSTSIGDVSVF